MKFEWEEIKRNGNEICRTITLRAKVFEGWVLKDIFYDTSDKIHVRNMVFIPDKNHKWSIDEE